MRRNPIDGLIKRQVFDISVPKIEVIENQAEIKHCTHCNHKISAEFPIDLKAPAQYGSRVKDFAIYLQNQHFIPEARLKMIFNDIFSLPIAYATLSNFSYGLSSKLSDFLESLRHDIYKAKVKHLDETGLRVDKKASWMHVASTRGLTHYRMSKRGDVPDKMLGIVVHDHWKAYFSIKNARHAMCNVHILRELKGIIEEDKEVWAKNMYRLLQLSCRVKNKYPEGIPKKWIEFISSHYFKTVVLISS